MIPLSFDEMDAPYSDVPSSNNEHDSVHEVAPVLLADSGPTTLTTTAAKFLLHLQEGRRVCQFALTDVIDTCNAMCIQVVNGLQQEIWETCVQANVDIDGIEGLGDILSRQPPHLFEGVNTIYRFQKFCVDHFDCLLSYIYRYESAKIEISGHTL